MGEVVLGIEGGEFVEGSGLGTKGQWPVEWMVCFIGFTTACMAVAAAVYKAPSGIFDDHKLAYYVSVVSAGVIGFGEVCVAAFWISGSDGHHRPHGLVRRCVMCVSFLPLAFMAGLGGVRILVK